MGLKPRQWTTRGLMIMAIFVFLLCGALYTNVLAENVVASWAYDYGPEPACSASKATNCIDHFEVQDITNQQKFVLIQKVANPNPAVGKMDHISTSFKYGPPFGQRTISVIAVGNDPQGGRITSNPFAARVTVIIRPGARASLVF